MNSASSSEKPLYYLAKGNSKQGWHVLVFYLWGVFYLVGTSGIIIKLNLKTKAHTLPE